MAIVQVKQTEYPLHPAGKFTGTISRINTRFVDTEWGEKEKIIFEVETDVDGERHSVSEFFTLSFGQKCVPNLRKFREAVLDHPLSAAELNPNYDTDELLGKRITFRVDHVTKNDKTYANIREGSVEPAGGFQAGTQQQTTQPPRQQAPPAKSVTGDDELPF